MTTSAFRGANNPKLAKVSVSQNRSATRNGTGIDALVTTIVSHRALNRVSASSSARIWEGPLEVITRAQAADRVGESLGSRRGFRAYRIESDGVGAGAPDHVDARPYRAL